jgi:cytoskeleton protein RodZ
MLSNAEILRTQHDMRFTFDSQEQSMETVGNYLRQKRREQGKTLEQIAEKTCITLTTLQAIEDDRDELLPPPSYVRGFLKLYAQELGLSTEELLERLPQQEHKQSSLVLPPAPDIETKKIPWLKIAVLAGVCCLAFIWAWQLFFGLAPVSQDIPTQIVSPRPALPEAPSLPPVSTDIPDQTDSSPDSAEPETETHTETEPAAAAAAQPADKPNSEETQPAAENRFTVQFTARGIVWMEMRSDDGAVIDITLRDGERYSATAERVLTVRLGNPALVDVTYNNQPVFLPGKPGVPLDLVFPDCVRQSSVETD